MESLSSYAKRFVAQVAKPDVDFVFGLSPVISIEQKTLSNNPRSTVGTMTDVASYLNLLFATIGQAHCPRTGEPMPSRTSSQILEAILSLPEGTEVELRAPVFPIYGEDVDVLYAELRKKGVRRVIVDGETVDLSDRDRAGGRPTTRRRLGVRRRAARAGGADGRHRRSLHRRPQAREGDQGGHRGDAADWRRVDAGSGGCKGASTEPRRIASTRTRAARRIISSTATSGRRIFSSTIPRARAARAAASAWTS